MVRHCLSILFYVLKKSRTSLPFVFEICEHFVNRDLPSPLSHLVKKILELKEKEQVPQTDEIKIII